VSPAQIMILFHDTEGPYIYSYQVKQIIYDYNNELRNCAST
jgi:hypothetical protein